LKDYVVGQVRDIIRGGHSVFARKIKRILMIILKSPSYVMAVPIVLALRIIRPWLIVRLGGLISSRIGHFAGNTELHLCEYDGGVNRPERRHIDIFYFATWPICNQQLAKMWKRTLRVWPAWILAPIARINQLIPGGAVHEACNTLNDRDVHNLLDEISPHLDFTAQEEAKGQANLQLMGIPLGSPFVCLTARDSAYLESHIKGADFRYHNYRDVDVQNYVLAAEELASRGYYVLRMGSKVHASINSDHPMVIDYATNGMRSDFMDIYLGANCTFCISCGTGFDAIPILFRRPVAFVNHVPIGLLVTCQKNTLAITKHHVSKIDGRELSLREILNSDVGLAYLSSDYESKDIRLIENTPEEICDLVIEMDERLNGTWQSHEDDELLQQKFWKIFPVDAIDVYEGVSLHGEIRSHFGASFLQNNRWWLE